MAGADSHARDDRASCPVATSPFLRPTGPPQVSVVIPTRNRRGFARRAVSEALAQEAVDVEVIVVDDHSTDGTRASLTALDEPRLRVLRNESEGVAAARNTGIKAARADWIAFLDDDDIWAPRKLRMQLDAALRRGASFAYSGVIGLNTRGDVAWAARAPDADLVLRSLLARNVIPAGSSNVLAKTELVNGVGAFDEAFTQLADWDLWIRLAAHACAAACDERLVGYVEHAGNMLLTRADSVFEELDLLERKHRDLRERVGAELDRAAFSTWVAEGQRRAGRPIAAAWTWFRSGLRNRNLVETGRGLRVALSRAHQPQPGDEPPEWLEVYRERLGEARSGRS